MSAESAVIDAPETTTATPTPHGRPTWKEATAIANAMEKAEADAAAKPAPTEPKAPAPTQSAAADKKPDKEQPKAPEKKPAKPASALDALLAGKPAAEPEKKDESGTDDPLMDFPLDAKDKDRNYAGLRKKAEDGWALARELKKQIGTPDPKLTGELGTLRKTLVEHETALREKDAKLAEMKDTVVAVNIELDPDHRREFIDGRKQQVVGAGAKLKAYGGDDVAFAEAMSLPEGRRRDEAVEALLEPLGESAKAKIMRAVADIEALDERRAAIMAKPQEKWEELQRRRVAQAEAQAEQSEAVKKATFDKALRELATNVPTLGFADENLEGGKDWNAARAVNNAAALALLGNDTTPDQIVAASIKAADYDRLAGLFMEARKIIAEQSGRLSEYEGAQPGATLRKKPAPTKEEELAKLTPGQRFAAQMGTARNEDF